MATAPGRMRTSGVRRPKFPGSTRPTPPASTGFCYNRKEARSETAR